jgi:hypothetical protein
MRNPLGECSVATPRTGKFNIEDYLREICIDVGCAVKLAQDRIQWRDLVLLVLNLPDSVSV